jgi:hypothetical protein
VSNNAKVGAVIVGLLTLLTAGLAFGEQLIVFIKPDDPTPVMSQPLEPDKKKSKPSADVVLEIGENPNTNVEAIISLNGDELVLFTPTKNPIS